MSSGSRPRTRNLQSRIGSSSHGVRSGVGGGGAVLVGSSGSRPSTKSKQRGYYSEVAGLQAAQNYGVSFE